MIGYVLGKARIVTIIALRVIGLFGVGLLIGFSGYTASAGRSHAGSLVSEQPVQRPISQFKVELARAQSPHLIAYSPGAFQVRFR
jgi:hypothetical protein